MLALPKFRSPTFPRPTLKSPTFPKPTFNCPMFARPKLKVVAPATWSRKKPATLAPRFAKPDAFAGAPMPVLYKPETLLPRFMTPDSRSP
ncbi:hypothetical protein LAUMK191_02109 [Mycobacterium attenuatum]|nr:hypothetical protein LAUMK191_02109 [Mycobacterium attenuatum]